MTTRPSMPPADAARLVSWLEAIGHPPDRLEPLAGDVSARRYLRLTPADGRSKIVAVYPASIRGACRRFARTTRLLESIAVRVPAIVARDCRRGLMVLEDLGPHTLYDRRGSSWKELGPWLLGGLAIGRRIARLPAARVAGLNPALDGELLRRELSQTWRLCLEPLGLAGAGAKRSALRSALDALCDRLGAAPPEPCHRDFMARNLVPLADGKLAVLDHQDLRQGPPLYDAASLLNDSLYPPPRWERRWLATVLSRPEDALAYGRAAAQRALKAVGTFAAFARRGDPRHLPLVRPTLARAWRHLGELPETRRAVRPLRTAWERALGGDPAADLLEYGEG